MPASNTIPAARLLAVLLAAAVMALPVCATRAADPPPRDFTVFLMSDTHVGAENLKADPPVTRQQTLAGVTARLEAARALVGRPYPQRPELAGTVAAPAALIILGDLTDGHPERAGSRDQWAAFDTLFPAEGLLIDDQPVPVVAAAGNHDGGVAGPQRRGLVARNRRLMQAGHLAAISENGAHAALAVQGVHFLSLNLCPADATDAETPFRFGEPGAGSWNDPQGALSFLRGYLANHVGTSGAPVVLMHHYGFDGFSLNDWNWWTVQQRRALYDLLAPYNVAAVLHGHNHHAEHYRWPNPARHAADLAALFGGQAPAGHRQYDVLSCSATCWVLRIRGDQLIAAHFTGPDWSTDPAGVLVKNLTP